MTSKPKVLVVTRNFPPLWGGMERLNRHLVGELSKRFDVKLIAPHGAENHVPYRVSAKTVPLKPLSRFLLRSAWEVVREAKRWRPDIIIAGSGLTAPLAVLGSKMCDAQSFAYAHGLDMTVDNQIYRKLWYPCMRQLDGLIANSRTTAELAQQRVGVAKNKIHIVNPGVKLPDVHEALSGFSRQRAKTIFCEKFGISEGPLLLSVGRLTERKGLRQFVADVLPLIVEREPKVNLAIIGDVPTDALHAAAQSQSSIQLAADKAGVGDRIHFLGKLFGVELAAAYQAADVHVFPVREIPNDPEGFGMVAVEAAAYGLPTVAYATGGVVDAVSEGESGKLVSSGEVNSFAKKVLELLYSPMAGRELNFYAGKFSWPEFGVKVERVIRKNL